MLDKFRLIVQKTYDGNETLQIEFSITIAASQKVIIWGELLNQILKTYSSVFFFDVYLQNWSIIM